MRFAVVIFFYAQALIVESKGGVKTFIPSYVQINNEEEDEVCISVGQGSSARVRFRFLTPTRAHFQFSCTKTVLFVSKLKAWSVSLVASAYFVNTIYVL